MGDSADKLAYFQAITGLEDPDLCTEILQAHGWDLEQAISSFTSDNPPSGSGQESGPIVGSSGLGGGSGQESDPIFGSGGLSRDSGQETGPIVASGGLGRGTGQESGPIVASGGLAWKIVTLPFYVVSGSLGLISGAVGLGVWAVSGVLSYSLGMVGIRGSGRGGESSTPLVSGSGPANEAIEFVASFEREYGRTGVNFVGEGFMDALQRSRNEYKLLFVYLHSPDHPDTPIFCERTLCNDAVAAFLNENYVAWGGSIRASEGFKMSNSFKASRFPFCAVAMAATNQRIALVQQVEGPQSPEVLISILQKVLEESAPVLVTARMEAEERRNNIRLREEQDAAYREALEADQARERQKQEEQERLEREAVEAERKRKEEEEAIERAAREAAEKEAVIAKLREEKAQSLGAEPEKGPDVTQVLVRFPSGERKDRRFHSTTSVKSLYDYVDSLGCLEMDSYSLVSNFPRTVYGRDKFSLSLKEAGLHPQASLFVEMNS